MRLAASQIPVRHLSATAINQLLTCPEQFRIRRIKKIPESRGPDKFIGGVDHLTLEHTLRYKMSNNYEDMPLEWIPSQYALAWEKSVTDEGEPEWYDSDIEEEYTRGEQMAVLYHDQITPTVRPIAVEERLEDKISGVPIPVIGYADVIESSRIIEKKTSKAKVSKPKPQWLLQGRIYQLGFDDKPIEWHLTTKSKTPGIFTPHNEEGLRLEASDRDGTAFIIRQAWGLLTDLWRRYGAEKPWPVTGYSHPFACGLCVAGPKYSARCRAWGGDGYQ